MNKIERVLSVLAGDVPDRPPVSFWYHFDKHEWAGQSAVDAHVNHVDTYDLDFVKIMNDNGYPRPACTTIETVADLDALTELNGTEGAFVAQLDLIRALSAKWKNRLLMSTTLFNAWSTLRTLVQPPKDIHRPPVLHPNADSGSDKISELLKADRPAVAAALGRIARSLANFSAACIDAGADGIFLSVRDDWVDTPGNGENTYDEIVRATDHTILEAASAGRFNMLHVCGKAIHFEAFAAYPVHAINWADRYAGPTVADVCNSAGPAICAGLDNLGTLKNGSPADCVDQVRDTLRQAGDRPLMVAPGCTYDPHAVPSANLKAIVNAVKNEA